MSLFDYSILIYLAWGWIRGRKRGWYRELYGLVSAILVLAMLTGYGLISSVWHLVEQLNEYSLRLSGVLGYLMLLLATIVLLWRIRRRSQSLKQGKPPVTGIPGSALGVLRTMIWGIVFVVVNRLLPMNLFESLLLKQSVILTLLEPILEFFHVA